MGTFWRPGDPPRRLEAGGAEERAVGVVRRVERPRGAGRPVRPAPGPRGGPGRPVGAVGEADGRLPLPRHPLPVRRPRRRLLKFRNMSPPAASEPLVARGPGAVIVFS